MSRIILFVLSGFIAIGFSCKSSKATSAGQNIATPKTSGQITPKTRGQIAAEQKKARMAEIKRQRELKRQQRLADLAKRRARYYGYGYYGRNYTRGRRGSTGGARNARKTTQGIYVLTGIYTINNENYAIIDGQTINKGDDIQGRKIVEILTDRVIIDDNGQRREVKIGESALPTLIAPSIRK
jgi:hypothetical protein